MRVPPTATTLSSMPDADALTATLFVSLPVNPAVAMELQIDLASPEDNDGVYDNISEPYSVTYYDRETYYPSDVRIVPWWDMHVTVLHIPAVPFAQVESVLASIERVARSVPPITGKIAGHAEFAGGFDGYPCVYLVDSADLAPLRQRVISAIGDTPYSREHGFLPHITSAYTWFPGTLKYDEIPSYDLAFDRIRVNVDDKVYEYRFAGGLSKTVGEALVDGLAIGSHAQLDPLGVSRQREESMKATVTKHTAPEYFRRLPDSAFLHVDKATGVRYFPVRDFDGNVDLEGVRLAAQRIDQAPLDDAVKASIRAAAQAMEAPTEKEGRRLSGGMLKRLSDALDTIRGLVSWGNYEDEDDTEETISKSTGALFIFKDTDGVERWLTLSSNGFEDREKEIVATAALEADVARADKDGDRGPLRLWHTPGTDFGDCDFQGVEGRFLIESGTFRSDPLSQHIKDTLLEYEDKVGEPLGISIGFQHPLDSKVGGVYPDIRIIERSVCPLRVAANPFTRFDIFKESQMDEAKTEWFRKTFTRGDDILASVNAATKELEGMHAFKALEPVEPPAPDPEPDEPAPDEAEKTAAAQQAEVIVGVMETVTEPIVAGLKALDTVFARFVERADARDAETAAKIAALTARLDAADAAKTIQSTAPRVARALEVVRPTESDQNVIDAMKASEVFKAADAPSGAATPVGGYIEDLLKKVGAS